MMLGVPTVRAVSHDSLPLLMAEITVSDSYTCCIRRTAAVPEPRQVYTSPWHGRPSVGRKSTPNLLMRPTGLAQIGHLEGGTAHVAGGGVEADGALPLEQGPEGIGHRQRRRRLLQRGHAAGQLLRPPLIARGLRGLRVIEHCGAEAKLWSG